MPKEVKPLTNVHDAIHRAQISESDRAALINANFKIHPTKKVVVEQICKQNGTTFSAFLRECCDGLIGDYVGEKAASDLEKQP